jgi:hypothetical protein
MTEGSCARLPSSLSAGGHDEQPWLVNNSITAFGPPAAAGLATVSAAPARATVRETASVRRRNLISASIQSPSSASGPNFRPDYLSQPVIALPHDRYRTRLRLKYESAPSPRSARCPSYRAKSKSPATHFTVRAGVTLVLNRRRARRRADAARIAGCRRCGSIPARRAYRCGRSAAHSSRCRRPS